MRTFARMLLLAVSLGFGIVKSQLHRRVMLAIAILSVLYFAGTVGDEVYRGQMREGHMAIRATYWSFLALLCNLTFVMWIYSALENVIKELKEKDQTAKLEMYESLAFTLAGFVFCFAVLTVIAVSSRLGLFQWPIEWEWVQLVVWPVLNFTVSSALCYIWMPTVTSSQYAFSEQVSTTTSDRHVPIDSNVRGGVGKEGKGQFERNRTRRHEQFLHR